MALILIDLVKHKIGYLEVAAVLLVQHLLMIDEQACALVTFSKRAHHPSIPPSNYPSIYYPSIYYPSIYYPSIYYPSIHNCNCR